MKSASNKQQTCYSHFQIWGKENTSKADEVKLIEQSYTVKTKHTPYFKGVMNLAHLSYTPVQICTPWQADWQPGSTMVSNLLTS